MLTHLPMTLPALQDAYAEGLTPAELIAEVYRRIAAVDDPALFLHLRDTAEVQAEAAALPVKSAATPLWGVPFVVKDNIDVAGLPTTAACPAFAYTAEEDAFVVGRLRAAGALLIGKTNLDQFATGLVGVRSPYGVPRNAIDPALVPGGSSSGSAVAVGHGLVSFSLGTDTAGSGRVPAALNNIVGLKPSLGALSASGVVPACRTLDTISIFAASVTEAYAVFETACAFDPADAYSRTIAPAPLTPPPAGLRIGVPSPATRQFFGDRAQAAMFDAALARLEAGGATLTEIDMTPFNDVAEMLYEGAWVAERYTVVEGLMQRQPEALHPTTAQIIGAARGLSAADAFRGIYRLKELERLAKDAMAGLDLLCVPTIPTFYTLADLEADPVTPNSNLGTYTNFVNLLDMCGLAVPTEARSDGRPGSVTLLGRSGADGLVAAMARLFEAEGAAVRPVPLREDENQPVKDDEIALAVCGAHMSGLPLNGELTSRGGRLLEATRTAPRYGLYALAGGPPARPGLLRREAGAAIEVEVWSLPKTALGSFLAGIPQPLSIGTVELETGTRVHGFLVEAAGLGGATEISEFGGWRGYLAAPEAASVA
ncbi:allophanate hydrolase [Marinovum sp.]|uniref:allophanate hydrolase n=1 Tax=Marinovum sp. TaxID=2024839 RepID=UPI002B27AA32|nr:allophanate hydrolase [Marinovum sp.]